LTDNRFGFLEMKIKTFCEMFNHAVLNITV